MHVFGVLNIEDRLWKLSYIILNIEVILLHCLVLHAKPIGYVFNNGQMLLTEHYHCILKLFFSSFLFSFLFLSGFLLFLRVLFYFIKNIKNWIIVFFFNLILIISIILFLLLIIRIILNMHFLFLGLILIHLCSHCFEFFYKLFVLSIWLLICLIDILSNILHLIIIYHFLK